MTNREIKFRVWNPVHEKMYYPETKTVDGNDTFIAIYGNKAKTIGWGLYDMRLENRISSGEHGDHILMQYTSLKDKNGKEIYEGDKIEYKFWNKSGTASIQFENGSFGLSEYHEFFEIIVFKPFTYWDEPERDCYPFIEIIGNVFENPELLNP